MGGRVVGRKEGMDPLGDTQGREAQELDHIVHMGV